MPVDSRRINIEERYMQLFNLLAAMVVKAFLNGVECTTGQETYLTPPAISDWSGDAT